MTNEQLNLDLFTAPVPESSGKSKKSALPRVTVMPIEAASMLGVSRDFFDEHIKPELGRPKRSALLRLTDRPFVLPRLDSEIHSPSDPGAGGHIVGTSKFVDESHCLGGESDRDVSCEQSVDPTAWFTRSGLSVRRVLVVEKRPSV